MNVRGCGGGSARMSTGLSECAVFRGCVGYTVHRARALPSGRICRRPPRPRPRCGRRAGAPGVRARVLGSQRGHREGFEAAGVAPGADTRRASRTFFTESCAPCVYWRFLSLTFYISNKHDLFFYFFWFLAPEYRENLNNKVWSCCFRHGVILKEGQDLPGFNLLHQASTCFITQNLCVTVHEDNF